MKYILYHGTDYDSAKKIQNNSFLIRPNPYHWLGNGIYFYFDKPLAEWWTSNPTKKFGNIVKRPALVKVVIECEEKNVLDMRKFDTYVTVAEEFERFFTKIYIPYHKDTISEQQVKCLFFDWYFLSNRDIKIIIGDFYSNDQPYFSENQREFFKHSKLLYGETQVCLKKDCQNIIIEKEVIELCQKDLLVN